MLADKRISQVDDTELRAAIKFCMLLVGLRAQTITNMEDVEKQMIVSFIRHNYSNHTVAEFKLAFNKAVAGQLDVKTETYENFSCEYIGRIMKAYRTWASVQYKESGLFSKIHENASQLPPPYYNPLELVQMYYSDFLGGKLNMELVSAKAYEIAVNKCHILLTEDEMMSIVSRSRSHFLAKYEGSLKKEEFKYLESLPVGESCEDKNVDRYAKALALTKWFKEQKDAGVTDIVKEYSN